MPDSGGKGHSDSARTLRTDQRRGDHLHLLVILVFVGASVFALGLVLVGWLLAPIRRSDLWLEIARAGTQLFMLAVVGGGVAAMFKYLETGRENRRRVDEYLLSVLRELVEAYNQIKAVRRTLRAHGFRSPETKWRRFRPRCNH